MSDQFVSYHRSLLSDCRICRRELSLVSDSFPSQIPPSDRTDKANCKDKMVLQYLFGFSEPFDFGLHETGLEELHTAWPCTQGR